MDGYRQLISVQCFVLSPSSSQHYPHSDVGSAGWQKRAIFRWEFFGRPTVSFFSEPIVLAMVLLDFIVAGVGYYRPLLPIFAKDILYVGPAGFGVLSSAPAVGGIIGTVVLLVIGDVEHKGLLALWSFLSYAVAVGFFAISTNFWLSVFLLGILGLVNSLQAVMRQTTFHLLTPDQVRGRAFAVFNMFSQGANSVGATQVGFMAALLGASGSLLFGCAVGSILTLSCWAALPVLRRFGTEKAL